MAHEPFVLSEETTNFLGISRRFLLSLTLALLFPTAARAQSPTPALDFRAVVEPGTIIGGHTFTTGTAIDNVALSDSGEIAFAAHWNDASGAEQAAVFTSHGIVVSKGDVIDGRTIVGIGKDATVAINGKGQVAYEAQYLDGQAGAMAHTGVFIDRHLATTPGDDWKHDEFLLADDGWIATHVMLAVTEDLSPSKDHWATFPQFPRNARGQFLIPLTLKGDVLLLLATPITH
jgi:hypothetical protein